MMNHATAKQKGQNQVFGGAADSPTHHWDLVSAERPGLARRWPGGQESLVVEDLPELRKMRLRARSQHVSCVFYTL